MTTFKVDDHVRVSWDADAPESICGKKGRIVRKHIYNGYYVVLNDDSDSYEWLLFDDELMLAESSTDEGGDA